MVTFNKDLLMAFVYFDQSHCGYLQEKDLEEIMYTLGLHLSRAQVQNFTFMFEEELWKVCKVPVCKVQVWNFKF